MMHLIMGTQGAGKSTYSINLAEQVNGVHFSIDDWMKELFGPDLPVPMDIGWLMIRISRCEQRIWSTAVKIAQTGVNVILDLGFLKVKDRNLYLGLAKEHGLLTQLHYIDAQLPTRFERVMTRNSDKSKTFSFEVSPAMFHYMENEFEPPNEEESKDIVIINTDDV